MNQDQLQNELRRAEEESRLRQISQSQYDLEMKRASELNRSRVRSYAKYEGHPYTATNDTRNNRNLERNYKRKDSRQNTLVANKKTKKSPKEEHGKKNNTHTGMSEKKLVGAGFWMMIGFTTLNEIVFFWAPTIPGLVAGFSVSLYLMYQGVSLSDRKLVTFIISFFIESVPGLSIIPTYPFTLFLIRIIENNPQTRKLAHKHLLGTSSA